jgi:acetyltransferase-like isoleucine patch superfamily enzyme
MSIRQFFHSSKNWLLLAFRHKKSSISFFATYFGGNIKIGNGVVIQDRAEIIVNGRSSLIEISDNSKIHSYSHLRTYNGSIFIGANTTINRNCIIYGHGGVHIGNNVLVAANVTILSANHRYSNVDEIIRQQGLDLKGTRIEDNVWIGINTTILGGVTIGSGSIIGAGSLVTKSIPPKSIAYGSPARVVKKL